MNISLYDPAKTASTKYLFFTGKAVLGKLLLPVLQR